MTKFAESKQQSFRSLLQALVKVCKEPLEKGVGHSHADHYVKRYHSVDFALGLVCHFILGLNSMRELTLRLNEDRALNRHLQLAGISIAHLPKLLHARPSQLWAPLVAKLLSSLSTQQVPSSLRLMDATFFRLGARLLSRRLGRAFEPENAGIKLSLVIDPETASPVRWVTSVGSGHDAGHAAQLLPADEDIAGNIYVFDRGYRKYSFYQELIDRDADFVTRAAVNDNYQLYCNLPLEPAAGDILADQIVLLGSAHTRQRMRSVLRRIVKQTAEGQMVFLTTIMDMSAAQIAQLYRRRWHIEIFFRWLKRQIGLISPLGYSIRAAEHTIFAAMVAYLLVLLLAQGRTNPTTPGPTLRFSETLYTIRAGFYQRPKIHQLRALGFL